MHKSHPYKAARKWYFRAVSLGFYTDWEENQQLLNSLLCYALRVGAVILAKTQLDDFVFSNNNKDPKNKLYTSNKHH